MSTGRVTPNRVVLSAEQREIAWNSRPDERMTQAQAEELYARNLLRFQRMKADGAYPER